MANLHLNEPKSCHLSPFERGNGLTTEMSSRKNLLRSKPKTEGLTSSSVRLQPENTPPMSYTALIYQQITCEELPEQIVIRSRPSSASSSRERQQPCNPNDFASLPRTADTDKDIGFELISDQITHPTSPGEYPRSDLQPNFSDVVKYSSVGEASTKKQACQVFSPTIYRQAKMRKLPEPPFETNTFSTKPSVSVSTRTERYFSERVIGPPSDPFRGVAELQPSQNPAFLAHAPHWEQTADFARSERFISANCASGPKASHHQNGSRTSGNSRDIPKTDPLTAHMAEAHPRSGNLFQQNHHYGGAMLDQSMRTVKQRLQPPASEISSKLSETTAPASFKALTFCAIVASMPTIAPA